MDRSPLRTHLDAQDWSSVYATLVAFAEARLTTAGLKGRRRRPSPGRDARAKDLAQEAIARIYAFDSKWDPEKEPSVVRYLMSVVNSLIANERSSAAARRNVSQHDDEERVAQVRDESAFSEERAAAGDLLARRLARLRGELAGDPEALRVLELTIDGVDTPSGIREATGWPSDRVTAARLRMHRRAASVAEALGGDEDQDAIGRPPPSERAGSPAPRPTDDDDRSEEVV